MDHLKDRNKGKINHHHNTSIISCVLSNRAVQIKTTATKKNKNTKIHLLLLLLKLVSTRLTQLTSTRTVDSSTKKVVQLDTLCPYHLHWCCCVMSYLCSQSIEVLNVHRRQFFAVYYLTKLIVEIPPHINELQVSS